MQAYTRYKIFLPMGKFAALLRKELSASGSSESCSKEEVILSDLHNPFLPIFLMILTDN